MGLGDLVIAYKFLRQIGKPWTEWEAYKLGLIDDEGRRLRKAETPEEKNAYPKWKVLIRNIKRTIEMLPFGKTRLGTYSAALWLLREEMGINNVSSLEKEICQLLDTKDILVEHEEQDLHVLAPGKYQFLDMVSEEKRMCRIKEPLYPVVTVLGTNVFEVHDIVTNEKHYITKYELI